MVCTDCRQQPPLNYNINNDIQSLRENPCNLSDPYHVAAKYSTEEALEVDDFGLSESGQSSEEEAVE